MKTVEVVAAIIIKDGKVFQCNVGCRIGDHLLPFESSERFNYNIKIIFEKAGVTYLVKILEGKQTIYLS